MATQLQNLSSYNPDTVPDGKKFKIGIVVAEWNLDITSSFCEGAIQKLTKHGVLEENIKVEFVPGSFELTLGAQYMAEYSNVDAILCLGCVIQGETRHFDFICQGVTEGITQLNLKYNI
ncbi:MAG: 6,7-dimethyl-8-ribityllumazine synthase, partial [Marinilabiliales bacterium]